jgi:multiple sugar transport system substrate-binding protein
MKKSTLTRFGLIVVIILMALASAQCAPAEPVTVVETVIVEQEVEVPVEVQVTELVEVESEKEIVTIAYNGYFTKTFGPADPPIDALRAEVAKLYPNIEIVLNIMPYEGGPWRDNYLTWFQAEDGTTDLLGVSNYWLSEFGSVGWLLPLDGVVSQDIIDGIYPAYIDAFSYDGELLGLGPWWGGIGGLYYRADLLTEVGVEPPTTYAELVAAVEAVQAVHPEMSGWTWPALKDQVLFNRWVEFFVGHGGEYFDADGACTMNSAEGVAALDFMKSVIDDGVTPRQALTWKEEDSQVPWLSGESIFHTGRNDMLFYIDNPEQSEIAGKWGYIPMVGEAAGQGVGLFEGWAFGISAYSDNVDAATKVLEVMFDFPVQKTFNLSQGPLQGNIAVYSDADVIANNPNMALIEQVAASAEAPIPSPDFAEIAVIIQEEVHSALTGTTATDAAMNNVCDRIDAIP